MNRSSKPCAWSPSLARWRADRCRLFDRLDLRLDARDIIAGLPVDIQRLLVGLPGKVDRAQLEIAKVVCGGNAHRGVIIHNRIAPKDFPAKGHSNDRERAVRKAGFEEVFCVHVEDDLVNSGA